MTKNAPTCGSSADRCIFAPLLLSPHFFGRIGGISFSIPWRTPAPLLCIAHDSNHNHHNFEPNGVYVRPKWILHRYFRFIEFTRPLIFETYANRNAAENTVTSHLIIIFPLRLAFIECTNEINVRNKPNGNTTAAKANKREKLTLNMGINVIKILIWHTYRNTPSKQVQRSFPFWMPSKSQISSSFARNSLGLADSYTHKAHLFNQLEWNVAKNHHFDE